MGVCHPDHLGATVHPAPYARPRALWKHYRDLPCTKSGSLPPCRRVHMLDEPFPHPVKMWVKEREDLETRPLVLGDGLDVKIIDDVMASLQ